MASLGETRRELVARFNGVTAYVRSPAKGLWVSPEGQTETDDVVMVEVVTRRAGLRRRPSRHRYERDGNHLSGTARRSRHAEARSGLILLTGSIEGFMPGTYQAVYNGTKAFVDSFSFALRAELKDTGVTVTCLMPGATETDFFERADMLDTKVGQSEKDDPADVARVGFDAMMRGDGDVVSGWKNKLQSAIANITPAGMLAEQHRKMAEPGSGQKTKG